jgi:hypothetical protein
MSDFKTKLVTAYWMDAVGYPFQSTQNIRKERYLGSLISHCKNFKLPIVCYTHDINFIEVQNIKDKYQLDNLEIKILELSDMKLHSQIKEIRDKDFAAVNELDGRGPEIMWGKFEVIEKELDNADKVFWIDCGLQHPGIIPWRYCIKYNKIEDHQLTFPWWSDTELFNFSGLLTEEVFTKLSSITEDKIVLLTSYGPQVSYPFKEKGIIDYTITTPFPIGGIIGGNTTTLKKFINYFWDGCNEVLNKNFLCTEEVIMKLAYDKMEKNELIDFTFCLYDIKDHDIFHFEQWDDSWEYGKPFYVIFQDILKY